MKTVNNLTDMSITSDSKLLVLMPHPDDEAVFTSSLLQKAAEQQIKTRVITFTQGEASTLRYTLSPNDDLATARKKELVNAFSILKVKDYQILDFPDGGLEDDMKKITTTIKKEIKNFKPTHLITLEPDGIYGHPDHIALSLAVTQTKPRDVKLLYATVSSNHVSSSARKMAKKEVIKPIKPEFRLRMTLSESVNKIRALRAHKTQFQIDLFHTKTIKYFLKNDMVRHEFYTYYS